MAIADKLTTIAGIKSDIRTAINGKGGSLTSGSPFSAYSAAISSLPSGGGGLDWSQIGYTGAPQAFQDAFSYAKNVYDNWNPTVTSLQDKFYYDKSIVYMPMVDTSSATNMYNMFGYATRLSELPLLDTSNVTNMFFMFQNCYSLVTVPLFDTSACNNMGRMFQNCYNLATVPQFNTSNVSGMTSMFTNCIGLTTVPQFNLSACTDCSSMFEGASGLRSIPPFNTSNCTEMNNMFSNCSSLQKITSLDMSKCTTIRAMFGYSNLSNLRFMLLKGLGTPSGVTSYDVFNKATNWGVDSTDIPDARQSLVDSLLTYSFDRATAGYATCTIKLSSDSYNQLTAQELADIQAKGYSITTR